MVRRCADAEVGSGRARAREGLRRGEEPLGVRLRHRQEALDQSEDHGRRHHTRPRQQAGLPRPRARRQRPRRSGLRASATRWTPNPRRPWSSSTPRVTTTPPGSPRRERERSDNRWWTMMGSSIWRQGAATFWPSTIRRPRASAAGCATPQARRRRWRSMDGQAGGRGTLLLRRRR